ncbi:MAG: methylenetetrahydrofolate reductase [NAD(P)H] [Clostridium sp.]|uniref:methylenetetrahydrofolate reductase [NAD(P)H] n=1 Tax=Butyribacter sp. TaxID=2822465 RepID=UPI002A9B90A0|nr:methylenetetrahydrofolate reductase [NAD(P)H] [Clostridium sp.]MDY5179755.1 methylenetetrahydrofolate reductase [NAD(P)H] [Butyribacter sp.]
MKISEILKNNKITLSMEVFPPKTSTAFETVNKAVKEIAALKPDFMSVTYGAGGGTSKHTVKIATDIKKQYGVTSMAHLTCVSSSEDTVKNQIEIIRDAGIENILALRGDIPAETEFPMPGQFKHASDLVHQIKNIAPDICIGGACYPEGHPEADDKTADIANIKKKVDAGCEFLTTQMFFDNSIFYNYLYRLREAGIFVPVIAGIMPITKKAQLARSIQLSGCCVPAKFKSIVDWFGDESQKMQQAGIAYATEQIIDLFANGIKNVHVYTMNNPEVALGIQNNLSEIIGK